MANIAAIGRDSEVLGLRVLGIDAFPVENARGVPDTLRRIAGNYSIILLEESLMDKSGDLIEEFNLVKSPILLPISMRGKSTGEGRERISSLIRRAIGISESVL